MRALKILTTIALIGCASSISAQSNDSKENSSKETVTKIIRIKGANGEEKIIKKQEVITKQSKIKLNPDDEDKTNQTATYEDQEVKVQKSEISSDMGTYTKISDGKGFRITFMDKSGSKVCKVRKLSGGYYNVNMGEKDNCIGHFDKDKNFIIEKYDSQSDQINTVVYKAI